jgi:signal transduction histidine kinase
LKSRYCIQSAAQGIVSVNLTKIFRTSTFRLALLYLLLFALSVTAVLGFIYWSTAGFIARQTDQSIASEIESLARHYNARGLGSLQRLIDRRAQNQHQSLYIIASPELIPLAGNLDMWPEGSQGSGGWVNFSFERPIGEKTEVHEARARQFTTEGGLFVLVGRDVHERLELEKLVKDSLLWTVGLTLALGLLGGTVMSRNVLNRIDSINQVSHDIMLGDLGRRVPVAGKNDEIDQLADNLNAMLDQIERLMTGMRQVTNNIAHDLRSPLNRLRSRVEVTLMETGTIDSYRKALEATVAEAEGLLHTFNALLSITQAESGIRREDLIDLDVAAITRDAAELYEPSAEEKGIAFSVTTADDLQIRGNRHLLSQALANLLDNAIKYTPKGGIVNVTASRVNGSAELVVTDSGPGIAEPDRERVFDRFVRLETSRNSPGSGLGLSLVRAVAQNHGADVELADNHPGLKVTMHIPILRPLAS